MLHKIVQAWRQTWKQLSMNKIFIMGLVITLSFVFMAIAAPLIAPFDPTTTFLAPSFSPPSLKHLLGTDDVGRDVLSLVIHGSRISLMIGLLSAALGTFSGTIIGLISGYYGGIVDELLMRITDIFLTLPFIQMALLFALYFGPSVQNIVLLFGFFGWPPAAREIRSQILSLKEATFIEAARAIGASNKRILFIHLLPSVFGIVIANVITRTIFAILAEAGLAFIGATDPRVISWGTILFYAQRSGSLIYGAWWTIIPPGFCIALLSLGFSFLGHGITLILNPKSKRVKF